MLLTWPIVVEYYAPNSKPVDRNTETKLKINCGKLVS